MSTQKRFIQKARSKQKSVGSDEEQKRLSLFRRILRYDDDSLKSELASFSSGGNLQRQIFVGQLLQMNPTNIKNYMKLYLLQLKQVNNPKNSESFYDSFTDKFVSGLDIRDEESKRREFFSRVIDIDDRHEFKEEIEKFTYEANAPQNRKDFIDKLSVSLNISLTKQYIRDFLKQRSKNSETYFREFMKREDIRSDKFFEVNKDIVELIDENIDEPSFYEMVDELDYGDSDIFEEEEGVGMVGFQVEDKFPRVPSWWKGGKIVKEVDRSPLTRFWILYTKQGCPYCEKAEKLLKDRNEDYIKTEITNEKLEKLKPKIGDYNTVPIVLLNDEFIGGASELEEKLKEIPVKQRGKIYEDIEGPIEAPTAFIGEVSRNPPPVTKTTGLEFDPSCYNKQVSVPWINGKVKSIWLRSPPGEEINMNYVIKGESVQDEKGNMLYKAGRSFYHLQCNYLSHKRRQNGYILTSYDSNNEPVRYIVVYELANATNKDKWVYQDKKIFNDQVGYLRGRDTDSVKLLFAIRAEIVSENARTTGKIILTNRLQEDMDVDMNDYVDRLEKSIYDENKTIESYFSAIVGITVFLDSWNRSIFKERVKSLFYQPETLPDLSISEKLPEVFDNPNISLSKEDEMKKYIRILVKKQVNDIVKQIARLRQPGMIKSRPMVANISIVPRIDTSKGPDCVQDLISKGIEPTKIMYYTDIDEKTYCFDVLELKVKFEAGEYINNESGNQFSQEFITKVLRFDPYTVDVLEDEKPISSISIKDVRIVAPGLKEKILEDIERMEAKMIEEVKSEITEVVEDTSDICDYCRKHIEENTGYKTMIERNNSYELVRFCSEKCFEDTEEWEAGNEPASLS